ncbi:unnamed protein product [Vicia faba]|uniref:Uncharacterized protein n=1 Tax=Vicia faba TaxID=3906 RepID=A0AAV0Z0Y4_VICFA|nr:unnamed protein product [Vicia faba]
MEPTTVKQALASPHWLQAMKDEFQALLKNQTWNLVTPPISAKPIGCYPRVASYSTIETTLTDYWGEFEDQVQRVCLLASGRDNYVWSTESEGVFKSEEKLNGWKEKKSSYAGKDILIKVVAQAIPNYVMSVSKIPIIDAIIQNY